MLQPLKHRSPFLHFFKFDDKEQLLHHQFHLKQKIYKYKNEKKNLYTGFGSRNNTRCKCHPCEARHLAHHAASERH